MSRNLSQGTTGQDVKNLQQLLNLHATPDDIQLVADGVFGQQTKARVVAFQSYCGITADGVAGPATGEMLLPERTFLLTATLQPRDGRVSSTGGSSARQSGFGAVRQARAPIFASAFSPAFGAVATPVTQQQPGQIQTFKQFQLQAGQQVGVGPFALSPVVITAQYNQIIRNPGKKDFTSTFGLQYAFNGHGANGAWTGQGFAQMGIAANKKVGKFLDLLNPFVVTMLQRNQGQHQHFTWGTGLGNQTNYQLDSAGRWQLFMNLQLSVNVDLGTGVCSAPGAQILGGVSFTFGALPPDP